MTPLPVRLLATKSPSYRRPSGAVEIPFPYICPPLKSPSYRRPGHAATTFLLLDIFIALIIKYKYSRIKSRIKGSHQQSDFQ